MNEAGPWGKGATEGTSGWEGAGMQDSGDTQGGHRVLKRWMEVKRQCVCVGGGDSLSP